MHNNFTEARHNLEYFVLSKVTELTKRFGFEFIETDLAPNTFTDLMFAYKNSTAGKVALPVFSGASNNTIYLTPKGNWGFRFWHDLVHCSNNFDFTLQGEIKTALVQLQDITNTFGKNSLEYRVFRIDTIGQATYTNLYGKFVDNQIAFAKHYLGEI